MAGVNTKIQFINILQKFVKILRIFAFAIGFSVAVLILMMIAVR
jgi:hypothetical protein